LTFSDDIIGVEINHSEAQSQAFVINGIHLSVPPGGWRALIGGTPGDTVEIPNGVNCVVMRME
jgi:hypothetical protein